MAMLSLRHPQPEVATKEHYTQRHIQYGDRLLKYSTLKMMNFSVSFIIIFEVEMWLC